MKIKDIILEATPINILPWTPSNPSVSGPTSSIAPRPRAQRQSGKRANALRKEYIKNMVTKMTASTRYKNMIAMKYSKFTAATVIPIRLLQFLGLAEMIVDFFNTKATLQIMKELPDDDPGHITEEEYDDNWRQALELLAVQILASSALPRILQAMALGKWVIRILGFFGTTATWGATLAIFVASEVAMIAFQRWLNSPEGRRQLSYLVVYCIDPLANWMWPTSLIDKVKELAGIETKKSDDKKSDNTKSDPNAAKQNPNQAAQPKPQGQTDTTIPTANVPPSYVGNPDDMMKRDQPKTKFAMNI